MNEDRIQVEAAFRYLSEPRTVKIDKNSCIRWARLIRGGM